MAALVQGGRTMLLALLYTEEGWLAGAAFACDVLALGRRYWREAHPEPVGAVAETDTAELACVDIDDELLVARLLAMDFSDGREAAAAVDRYLFGRPGPLADPSRAVTPCEVEERPLRSRPR
jgi:hypothetical protein